MLDTYVLIHNIILDLNNNWNAFYIVSQIVDSRTRRTEMREDKMAVKSCIFPSNVLRSSLCCKIPQVISVYYAPIQQDVIFPFFYLNQF